MRIRPTWFLFASGLGLAATTLLLLALNGAWDGLSVSGPSLGDFCWIAALLGVAILSVLISGLRAMNKDPQPQADATELQAVELRLCAASAEESLLRGMLDGLGESVLLVDAQQRVLRSNRAFRELWGFGQEVQGTALSTHACGAAVARAIERAFIEHAVVRESVRRPDGRSFDVLVRELPRSPEEVQRALVLFIDTTRLEALEDMRRKFVADVSHELRTPIAAIIGSVETVRALPEGERVEADRFLNMAERQAQRLSALVSDLLDLSQIEVGAVALDMESLSVAELMGEAIELARASAQRNMVSLNLDVQGDPHVTCDRRRMEQILGNLIDNAIKFNRPGGTVTLRATTSQGRVRIEVIDTGRGIPPEMLPQVFTRFFRADKSRDRSVGGTGLGLAIVKHLVHLQGGNVNVESTLGTGTRFVLDWPVPRTSSGG
jgi:two-component system phosphate regulon sensor histidine kinase PhoR